MPSLAAELLLSSAGMSHSHSPLEPCSLSPSGPKLIHSSMCLKGSFHTGANMEIKLREEKGEGGEDLAIVAVLVSKSFFFQVEIRTWRGAYPGVGGLRSSWAGKVNWFLVSPATVIASWGSLLLCIWEGSLLALGGCLGRRLLSSLLYQHHYG